MFESLIFKFSPVWLPYQGYLHIFWSIELFGANFVLYHRDKTTFSGKWTFYCIYIGENNYLPDIEKSVYNIIDQTYI